MKFINGARSALKSRSKNFISIVVLIASILFLPGAGEFPGTSQVALAATDPVIAAAGDIACDPANSNFNAGNGTSNACRQKATSDLLVNAGLAAVLPLGDVQYFCGGYQAFLQSYDLSWGRVKSISRPVVGNHEYITSPDTSGASTGCDSTNGGAAGYFNYFGTAAGTKGQGYYSYDIGAWHIIALNSNCGDAGGCSPSSPQGQWLEADLNTHTNFCTLAYWHIPLFSSGGRDELNSKDLWQILYNHNADVILNGHDHIYERFAPQAPNGVLDTARGMREFIVGSGGANHTTLVTTAANSEVRNATIYGVLKMTLHPTSYDWQFVPEAGKVFNESGTGVCHGSSPDTLPPTAPTGLTASALSWNQVSLNWTAGTDNVGVTGYQVFRNGVQIGSTSSTSYVDATAQAQTTYNYTVKTVDGVGLTSGPSNTATVTTPEPSSILTFAPAADAEIQFDKPTTNFGLASQFVVDNSPVKNALMKFSVAGVGSRTIVNAKLRLYCLDGSPAGGAFHRVANTTWTEGTVTWNTAPAADSATLASLGKVVANSWYEVDVTSLVTGDGTYSLRVDSTNADGVTYASRENAAPEFVPQLVVTTSGPTPTAIFTPTKTSTPTAIPTITSTVVTSTSVPTFTPAPQGSLLFSDGFETGNLSQWSNSLGLVVQNQPVASGSFAARGTSLIGGATYARKSLASTQTELYYRILFNVISQGSNTVNLMKFRTAADTPILSVSINNLGNLSYRNDLAGTSANSTVSVSPGSWQSLQVHVKIADTASQVEVWYNNSLVGALSRTEALGTVPIGILQLGENTPALTYDIAFDDIAASASLITSATPTIVPTLAPSNTPTATATSLPSLTPTKTTTPTATSSANALSFAPSADTYVESGLPTTNFGSASQFVTDNSPVRNMLLKFDVSGVGNKSVLSVKLRLYCVDGSPFGGEFHRVANSTWSESSVNWNTAPAADAGILASLAKVSANTWYEIDVTSLITGDGTYSLKINSTNSDGAYYSTKEGTAGFAPQLIITTGSSPVNTPTSAPPTTTPVASFTPFPTATWTATATLESTPTETSTQIPSETPTTTPTP